MGLGKEYSKTIISDIAYSSLACYALDSTYRSSYHCLFFFSSRRRHTRLQGDWSSDVCSSDWAARGDPAAGRGQVPGRQALPRAHLLGPGQRAGAGGPAGPGAAARGGRGDGPQAAGRDPAFQRTAQALSAARAHGVHPAPAGGLQAARTLRGATKVDMSTLVGHAAIAIALADP